MRPRRRAARSGRPAIRTGGGRAARLPAIPSSGRPALHCAARPCASSGASGGAGRSAWRARGRRAQTGSWRRSRRRADRSRNRRPAAGDEAIGAAEGGEKIMKERTVKVSQGWRRAKRRMRSLIRKIRRSSCRSPQSFAAADQPAGDAASALPSTMRWRSLKMCLIKVRAKASGELRSDCRGEHGE